MRKKTYVFGCLVCQKIFKTDEPGEPCCTGPSEMRDDHELVVMHLLRVENVDVHPSVAAKRAAGPLFIPSVLEELTDALDGKIIIPDYY